MFLNNLDEFEVLAKQKLSPEIYDYYAGGANDEVTLRENRSDYNSIKLCPRVLANVGSRDLSTTVLGQELSSPIMISPMGFQGAATADGELATVRVAQAFKTIMTLSTMSNVLLEDAIKITTQPLWFQLYIYKDRKITESLVKRAEYSGYKALVLTVDTPTLGKRERDVKNGFRLPKNLIASNLSDTGLENVSLDVQGSSIEAYTNQMFDESISWEDVEWLKSITTLPIVIKGLTRPQDAALAIEHGVSAIVVSNHGGRQLDTTPSTISLLPEIASFVDGRLEVFIDGGIRRGTDIVKAIALGADAVFLGRPILWGLAVDGEKGASRVMEILSQELDLAMTLCGYSSIVDIKKDAENLVHGGKRQKRKLR